jgi:hypothetical protein
MDPSAARWVGVGVAARVAPVAVGIVSFVASWVALLPGVWFWDTGELQAVGPLMGIAHPTGFPTYVLLGWLASVVLAPLGEPAFRMNVFAAVCVAVAAGVTVDLVRALTRSTATGVLAGLGLALTPIVWSIGTHAEAHALHLALVAILLRLLVAWEIGGTDRALIAAAVVFGLAMGNHSLTLLLAPGIGLYVLAVDPRILRRPRLVLACLLALVGTVALVYLELPLRAGPFQAPLVYGRPETWEGFWYIVLAEQFRGSLMDPLADFGGKLAILVDRTVASFGPLAVLLPLAFLATVVRQRRYALLTGTGLVITCLFAASYVNADIDRYYLGPVLIGWTWIGIGAALAVDLVEAWLGGTRGSSPRPGGRRTALAIVIAGALLVPTLVAIPARHARVDQRHNTTAAAWLDRALAWMERDAVVVSWWSYSTPLWYAQLVEGRRPDIAIIDDRTRLDDDLGDITDVIDANLGRRPVYVIRADPNEIALLEARYVLEHLDGPDAASLSRVVARRTGA